MKDTKLRSITKGVSWRIFGSIDTFLLSWLIFQNPKHAGSIALLELCTKVLLYFLHERFWNIIKIGRHENGTVEHWRSLLKGITWRLIGSIDSTILSWLVTDKLIGAFKLGFSEIITKIILFYLHERLWVLIKWGRIYEVEPVLVKDLNEN
ncbi:MAG: hypothetical protein A2X08_06610 [Bacteroidetes bacterium GWA2_32_17]|nr:MAG: hypothetical protein A2X08_06610 [Bacteroidetes bacterium GWA2_32_17]